MRSSLTRNVYRRLLVCHGLPCSVLSSHTIHRLPNRSPRPLIRHPQRRTFFNIFQKPPREVKEAEPEPGYPKLLEFAQRNAEGVKLPPRGELLQGFRDFFFYKLKYNRTVNSTQVFCVLTLLRYLLDSPPGGAKELGNEDLIQALEAILKPPRGRTDLHLQLAKELYAATRTSNKHVGEILQCPTAKWELRSQLFQRYILALTRYGASKEAADIVAGYWRRNRTLESVDVNSTELKSLWILILRGLAKEGKEDDLEQLAEELELAGCDYSSDFHEILTTFYARRDKHIKLKRWFDKPIAGGQWAKESTYLELIRFSTRQETPPKWVKKALQDLCDSNPPQGLWDVIFQWAVFQGQGVEEVKRMIGIMASLNKDTPDKRPSIDTINGLIRAAIEQKNHMLADRFGSLATELDLRPNSTTYALQVQVRMIGNDVNGAFTVFKQTMHIQPIGKATTEATNKYLKHLCSTSVEVGIGRVLDVLSFAERQEVDLEPETVVALCMAFLKHDLSYEVLDTLSLHAIRFSIEERELIQDAFIGYCLNRETSTARAWDGYSLLRQFFAETGKEKRVKLMNGFFGRKRADMACYVFGHMRAHPNPAIRPDIAVYVRCLEGLGTVPDLESLKMIHNMFKMDAMIQPNTKLYNAFMIASRACDQHSLAFEFWQDITNSAEGPTYKSLEIVLRVCQISPFGDDKAKQIWEKMQRMDIEVPTEVYMAYCMAMAAHGHVGKVQELIEGMKVAIDAKPTLELIAEVYNSFPGGRQTTFGKWAAEQYPDIWKELKKRKWTETAEGKDRIRFKARELKA